MTKENHDSTLYEITLSHQQLLHLENALKHHCSSLQKEWFYGGQEELPEELKIVSDMKNVVMSNLLGEKFNAQTSDTESLMWIKAVNVSDFYDKQNEDHQDYYIKPRK